MMQYVADLSTHHSPIACESQNIWTLVEHLHLLEIYYHIFLYKHFPKDKNVSSQHSGSDNL